MARYCHASSLRRLELETEKVQTGSTQVKPCQVYKEGSKETPTSRGFTRQDCIDYYIGKLGAFLYSYHSNPSIYRMKTFDEAFEIWSLWDKYLTRDKRSFMEYFEEEHGIILKECTSFETIKSLCETFIKQ